jgi:hypothetical protein
MDGHPSGYKFPIQEENVVSGRALMAQLDQPKDMSQTVAALHHFVFPLLSAREIGGQYCRWDEVSDCFLAVYCLKPDGNFLDAKEVTHPMAILKYLCRGSILYEALRLAEQLGHNPYK